MFTYACELSLAHFGFFWLSLAHFGSLLLQLALSVALSGSYWLSPCLSLALTATLWHTLVLSGSLLLSNFAYTALDQLTGPLLSSQRCCHADTLYPGLQRRYLFKTKVRKSHCKKTFVLIPTHKTRPDVVVRMCTYSKLNDTPKLQ